jgi:hypothetical protein
MTDRKKPGLAFWATALVVVLLVPLAIYLGAYAWLVEPTFLADSASLSWVQFTRHPRYPRLGGSPVWEEFFGPANWVDRRIRPEAWKTMEISWPDILPDH